MTRSIYLAAFSLVLLTCLYVRPVGSTSTAESKGLTSGEERKAWRQEESRPALEGEDDEEDEDGCAYGGDDASGYHNGLKRRCIGKKRKAWWQRGSKDSTSVVEADVPSTESLLVAEQQLHFDNMQWISRISDPVEAAEAAAAEDERRRQQGLALKQTR